jgi:hypothetical protein
MVKWHIVLHFALLLLGSLRSIFQAPSDIRRSHLNSHSSQFSAFLSVCRAQPQRIHSHSRSSLLRIESLFVRIGWRRCGSGSHCTVRSQKSVRAKRTSHYHPSILQNSVFFDNILTYPTGESVNGRAGHFCQAPTKPLSLHQCLLNNTT